MEQLYNRVNNEEKERGGSVSFEVSYIDEGDTYSLIVTKK